MHIAFIGLGTMGYPMAGHLAKSNCTLSVYNRTLAKALTWQQQHHGMIATTVHDAVKDADFIISCIGNDLDIDDIAHKKDGILSTAKKGAIWIDHTTASAEIAQKMAQAMRENHGFFIDAPVSGGQQGAEKGCLTIMCGGEPAAFDQAKPILSHYARMVTLMGPAGHGQLTKMVNQICAAGLIQALAEGIAFAQSSGLNPEKVIEVISKGAAQSWQMENRSQTMIAGHYEHGFAVEWMRKDLGLCLTEAKKNGVTLPVTALVDQFYAEVENMGGKRWDTSSLLARMLK